MPWLTPTVYKQGPAETLFDVPGFLDGAARAQLNHIVFGLTAEDCPFDNRIQDLTFATMQIAKRFVQSGVRCIGVPLFRDGVRFPDGFAVSAPVCRTVLDLRSFRVPRKLPLLFDILESGVERIGDPMIEPENQFVILTNSDIHPLPHFYGAIARLIHLGYDTIIVNRRTIPTCTPDVANIPVMYAEFGSDHPGYDCFIFPLRNYRAFVRTDACIGAGWVMRSMLYNMVATATRMCMLTHAHMTFHIGDDRPWLNPELADYLDFNLLQAKALFVRLSTHSAPRERLFPFCEAHDEPEIIKALAGLR